MLIKKFDFFENHNIISVPLNKLFSSIKYLFLFKLSGSRI